MTHPKPCPGTTHGPGGPLLALCHNCALRTQATGPASISPPPVRRGGTKWVCDIRREAVPA